MNKVNMNYLYLTEKKIIDYYQNCEMCLVVLTGTCNVKVIEEQKVYKNIGKRRSVFDGTAACIYIPKESSCEIVPVGGKVEIVIVSSPAENSKSSFCIQLNNDQYEKRGKGCYERRVYNLLDNKSNTNGMIIGETYHVGVWSGFPPHKHEIENYPHELEECENYFIKIYPATGFGIFINYKDNVSNANLSILGNNSIINVDSGYHCVVSSPNCQFYYLWALYHPRKEVVFSVDKNYLGK